MDFQKLINDQISQYINTKLPETMNKHIDSMLDNILSDIFSTYGENAKSIKKGISEKINVDLSYLKIMDYNGMIASAVDSHFATLVKERSCKPVLDILSGIVGDPYPKDTITLDELVSEVSAIFEENAEWGEEIKVPFYAEYNKKHKWIECWTDDSSDTDKRDCGIRFMIGENGTIFSLYFLNYSGNQQSPMNLVHLDPVERLIHKIYTSGVKITHDELEDGEIDFGDLSFTKED